MRVEGKGNYKFTEDGKLVEVLDSIIRFGSLTKACEASGIAGMTLSRWRNWSEDGKSEFQQIEYRGEVRPFHIHVEDCIMQSVDEVESITRAAARDGFTRPTINKGEYRYEDCEYSCSLTSKEFECQLKLDDETREMCGYPRIWEDKKKRVFNEETGIWERVKVMEWIPPSLDAQALVLRSWSDRYADKRSLNINGRLDINQSLGVTVIGKPLLPPPPHVEVITPQIAEAINEAATDAVYDEIDNDDGPLEDEQMSEQDPEQAADKAIPARVGSQAPSSLSPEQHAILERLKSPNPSVRKLAEAANAAMNRPAKPVAARPLAPPAPSTFTGNDQDDTIQRRPVGYKVL
jgi:hypothetical protein